MNASRGIDLDRGRMLAARRDDRGVSGSALLGDRLEIGGRETRRLLENGLRDFGHVTGEPGDHRTRRCRVGCQPRRQRRPHGDVGRIDQPQRQLGVVALVFRRMRSFLQIEIGQHPQQGRAHIDAFMAIEIEQTFDVGESRRRLRHGDCAFAATLAI